MSPSLAGVPSMTYTARVSGRSCFASEIVCADPEPALQSDDVVVAVQLPWRRNGSDNRRAAEEPAVLPRKTQRAEPRRDDDVDLPACVLPCEVTREYLRLSRTRESLALDGLLVELDVRGLVSSQRVGERRVEPSAKRPAYISRLLKQEYRVRFRRSLCRQPAIPTGDDNEAADAGDDRGTSSSLHGRTDVQGSRRRLYASRTIQGI